MLRARSRPMTVARFGGSRERRAKTPKPVRLAATLLVLTIPPLMATEAALSPSRSAEATVGPRRIRPAADELDVEAVFEMMKESLVGEWTGALHPIQKPVEVTYYLSGNGSALVEDMRPRSTDRIGRRSPSSVWIEASRES